MTVKGQVVFGLIVDPGASRGLIGSETLRLIVEHILAPRGLNKDIRHNKSDAKFTGISSSHEHSLGMVSFPIGLIGITRATYTADVIGGESSTCPGLIPLRALIHLGCVLICDYYPNQDGILAIKLPKDRRKSYGTSYCFQRLMYTDSGHYMLPIDNFDQHSVQYPYELEKIADMRMSQLSQTPTSRPKGVVEAALHSSVVIEEFLEEDNSIPKIFQ